MADKFVRFMVRVEDNEIKAHYTISSIKKETKATFTLKDDVSNSKYGVSEYEYKRKKSDLEFDVPKVRYETYSEEYPFGVFMNKLVNETLITDDFLADVLSDMKKILVVQLKNLLERTKKKIDLLN